MLISSDYGVAANPLRFKNAPGEETMAKVRLKQVNNVILGNDNLMRTILGAERTLVREPRARLDLQ